MDWLVHSIHAHQVAWALGSYYVMSSAIGAMPTPASGSNGFYRWFFDFSHVVSANVSRVIATRYPQVQQLQAPAPTPPPQP